MLPLFTSGILIFTIASVYFFTKRKRFGSELPWLVSFITIVSYVVMLGLNGGTSDPTLFTRWLGYALSCTLLTVSLLDLFAVDGEERLVALVSTPLIMLTGFLASVFSSDLVLAGIIFGLGCVPFVRLIGILRSHQTPATRPIMNYLYFGWLGFPIVFLLSGEYLGVLPSVTITLSLYLALDVLTKIIFYFSLTKAKRVQAEMHTGTPT